MTYPDYVAIAGVRSVVLVLLPRSLGPLLFQRFLHFVLVHLVDVRLREQEESVVDVSMSSIGKNGNLLV